MRSKKTYIILIIILFIFFIIMFLLFGVDNIRKNKYETSIIVGEDSVFALRKQKWYNVQKYDDFNWKKYNIYLNNEYFGKYYLWNDDKWYAFDKEKNPIDLDGSLLGINSNYKVNVYNFKAEDVVDSTYIDKVLSDNEITSSKFTSKYKVNFDFDNDLVDEDFYVISNAFILDDQPEKIFSIVFMVKDEEIKYIYKDVRKNTSLNGCKPYINSILDIDNDNKYEFILGCAEYSVSKNNIMLYQLKNNEFKILISNQ